MTALAPRPGATPRWPASKVRAAAARAAAVACALLGLCFPALARAQVGATLGLESDYRLRGLSLTDRRPALTLSLAYDGPSGGYAGGSLVGLASGADARLIGSSAYAGFTAPLGGGRTWDAGVSYQDYNLYFERKFDLHYSEIYLGIVGRELSAHLYFKPSYPRHGVNSAYVDVSGTHRLAQVWRLSAHAGAHERLDGSAVRDGRRWRYDTRLGVAREFSKAEVEVSWAASAPDKIPHPAQTHAGLAISGRYFF